MKAGEFKKILKPLIKQAVNEVLLEEGILSKVVSEVVKGMSSNMVVESATRRPDKVQKEDLRRQEELLEQQRQEKIKKLNESTNLGSKVFENVRQIPESDSRGPLSGVSSNDPGVDITGIQNLANGKWKAMLGNQ
jgi:hypothetical protein